MEYPKEGEYWFDREGTVRGPLRPFGGVNFILCYHDGLQFNSYQKNGRASIKGHSKSDLVQRAEITRVGPKINQDDAK